MIEVYEWRRRHKRCKFCEHAEYKGFLPSRFGISIWCSAKKKFMDDEIPRIFCKIYKVR